jgi:hypothetical protein
LRKIEKTQTLDEHANRPDILPAARAPADFSSKLCEDAGSTPP